jgi:hypothetical protein
MMHGKRKTTPMLCLIDIQNSMHNLRGVIYFDGLSMFISKMKSYLCRNQSPKGGRLKVHLTPNLISVIENNPNKNLIVSMSIKQEFKQQKEEKKKETPQIRVNPNEGSLREFKGVSTKFSFIFFEYKNTVLLRGACG